VSETPDNAAQPSLLPADLLPLAAAETPPVADVVATTADSDDAEVTLVKPCRVTFPDGHTKLLKSGVHSLPAAIADNWFIQAHTANPPPAQLLPGTPAFVDNQRKLAAAAAAIKAAEDQQVLVAADAARDAIKAKRGKRG
jgi:hypothetical protein